MLPTFNQHPIRISCWRYFSSPPRADFSSMGWSEFVLGFTVHWTSVIRRLLHWDPFNCWCHPARKIDPPVIVVIENPRVFSVHLFLRISHSSLDSKTLRLRWLNAIGCVEHPSLTENKLFFKGCSPYGSTYPVAWSALKMPTTVWWFPAVKCGYKGTLMRSTSFYFGCL